MELARVVQSNINISSELEVLSYTHTGDVAEILVRVDLGDGVRPIVGGGVYVLNIYLDTVLVTPVSVVNVPAGATKTIMVSRQIPIEVGDVVSIRVTGLSGDTNVNTITSIRDATPAKLSDFVGGGSVMVDHDYGGADELTYETSLGAGIDNAQINVYLKTDYDAGNRSNTFVVARAITDVNGHWERAVMLDPETYTLIYYKQGAFGPDRRDVTVT